MPPLADMIVVAAMGLGTFLMLTAAIGLLRFPDIYCRMHAAGKAGTLGVALIILAAIVAFLPDQISVAVKGALAILFQFMTTPAATHLLAHASYMTDYPLTERTAVDELKGYLPSVPDKNYGRE